MKKLFVACMALIMMVCFGCGNKPAPAAPPAQTEQKVPPSGRARKASISPEEAKRNAEIRRKYDSDFHAQFESVAAQQTELRRKHMKGK